MALHDTPDQMDFIYIFQSFSLQAARCTFFSRALRTFSRIDHMLGHETGLSKFKKTEIISSISSDHNGINWKSITRGKNEKHMETK